MVKPLRSDDSQPKDIRFKHFGVLDAGSQSKSSLLTSVTLNVLVALILFILGAAAKLTVETKKIADISLVPDKPKEPPKPKIIPKPLPLPPPPVIKVEPPKIKFPDVKLPDVPKPPEIKLATPMPVILPAPTKLVTAPAAPKIVNLAQPPQAAAIANHSAHPSAIQLGAMDNPVKTNSGPTVSNVNLGHAGAANMPTSNTGLGPVSKVNLGGNGSPSGNLTGNGVQAVQGVKLGVAGGTGPMNAPGKVAGPVNLGQAIAPAMPKPAAPMAATKGSAPKVLYKPKPEYTAEAIAKHIEGTVTVRLRVSATGAVQVLGVTSDLGYGLGDAAVRAVQGTRFQPATDADGHPMNWEGIVNVAFQLAG
jgi:TonB family protein